MIRLHAAFATCCLTVVANLVIAADPSARFVSPDKSGRLQYDEDALGNRIPDFSHCGYRGGGVAIPDVPVRATVAAGDADNGALIQQAIDFVSKLPRDEQGFRGTVLLLAGKHLVAGQLRITSSGVVLRGQSTESANALIIATGLDRRALFRVGRAEPWRINNDSRQAIVDEYVPLGAVSFRVASSRGLSVGDAVLIAHPSSREWISALGMDRFPSRDVGSWLDWKPGTMDLSWDRTITRIDGDTITVDAPLTNALDAKLSRATVVPCSWPERIEQIGIENLRCESEFSRENSHDEEHAWDAISFDNTSDSWVRQVTFKHFAGSAVALWEGCRRITVEDCDSQQPVSEPGGYRRHTFFTSGQQSLFQRCRADQGRHDFAVGHLASGPNAFVNCQATNAQQFSGPIGSWASGVLFDNVDVDGGGLSLTNRETAAQGTGWSAANCVLWQCTAPRVACRMPPTAQNWAIGVWGEFIGDGHWRSLNEFVQPDSLYRAQLAERLGSQTIANIERRTISGEVARGVKLFSQTDGTHGTKATAVSDPSLQSRSSPRKAALTIKHGRLFIGDQLLTGGRIGTVWWRGSVWPSRAGELGVGVTRLVPGRNGTGFTDDLDVLTDSMQQRGQALLEHHWGLWYDRRRDDHQMIRRIDGEVWPPFYEQPWARSGQGQAWDGLSKYDLSRFNPWYFSRLKSFADVCDQKGLVLLQQMYFQHNVLEAGAHWADFPWRPANCLQDTGFPEPPPYVNKKRIFLANTFYDVSHSVRRELHRAYIRHCLDVLGGNGNVIFSIGEEFTGPLKFVQFWLETIADWQRDTGRDVLVSLSCTKDVQDAVLQDPRLSPLVDVIDLKYWWYTSDGGLFAPAGGTELAPRQQLREWRGNTRRNDESIARQIREVRSRHPDKAVLCSLPGANPKTVLAAGGSLPDLSRSQIENSE